MLPHSISQEKNRMDSISESFFSYSPPVRFFVSSLLGTIVFLFSYEIILVLIDGESSDYGGTLAWMITYALNIWLQHELNERLVLMSNGKKQDYWKKLGRTYLIYTSSMLLSTLINMIFLTLGFSTRAAMILTLSLTGIGNYFLVNRFMK